MTTTNLKPIIVSLAVLASSAYVVSPEAPHQDPQAKKLVLAAESHDLREFIDRVAQLLGHNYLQSETDFQNQRDPLSFTLQNVLTLDAKGCEEVLGQVLFSMGFAIVPVDVSKNIYEIINMQGPKRSSINAQAIVMTPEEVLNQRHKRIPVFCTLVLEHINGQTAVTQTRHFFSQSGSQSGVFVGSLGGGKVMLVQGFSNQVAAAIDILRRADVPNEMEQAPIKRLEARLTTLEKRIAALEK